jgi:hypothetical protein
MNTPVISLSNRILKSKAAILSLVIVFAACGAFLFKTISARTDSSAGAPAPAPIDSAAKKLVQEEHIREAVFRYQFENNVSGQQKSAKAYFLSLGAAGKPSDPSNELLARFINHNPPVKKVSQCTFSVSEGVKDRSTGERGLVFMITKINWISSTSVEVEGGYYEAGLSGSANRYLVKFKNGKWVVTEDTMLWISWLLRDVATS